MTDPPEQPKGLDSALAYESISGDLECAGCGYNLRTLALVARCTECGLPVKHSLPPAGFRFRKMATAIRVRRGLTLLGTAILMAAVGAIAVVLMMRYYYEFPLPWLRINFHLYLDVVIGAQLLALLGALLITFPFGRRGDRFLRRVALAVLVLAMLAALAAIIDLENVHDSSALSFYQLDWWTIMYSAFVVAATLVHALAWLHLLARIHFSAHRALWAVTGTALLVQVVLLCKCVWQFFGLTVANSMGWPEAPLDFVFLGDPGSERFALRWERQLVGLAWIVTLIGVWIYVRALNRAIPDGRKWVATHSTQGQPDD